MAVFSTGLFRLSCNSLAFKVSSLTGLLHHSSPYIGLLQSKHLLFQNDLNRTLRSSSIANVELYKTQTSSRTSNRIDQEIVREESTFEDGVYKDVIAKVNSQIAAKSHGRLFAIVHVAGKQFRVTDGDLILIEGNFPAEVGDAIRLEKVLLLGSRDFSLLGRPLLRPDLVRIEATIVEKSLTHSKVHFRKKRRKQYMRINFYRVPFSILRINCVQLSGIIDQKPEVEGIDGRVF